MQKTNLPFTSLTLMISCLIKNSSIKNYFIYNNIYVLHIYIYI